MIRNSSMGKAKPSRSDPHPTRKTSAESTFRERIENAIDKLVTLLDAIDGDIDLEEVDEREPDVGDEGEAGADDDLEAEHIGGGAL